jgi:phage FluMu protein Com
MNIYDTKVVRCSKCGKSIGEIEYDAVVTLPKCGYCANPIPEGDDKALYVISKLIKSKDDDVYNNPDKTLTAASH